MKRVKFSKNKYTSQKTFSISNEDYERVTKFSWYLDYDGKSHYRVVRAATKEERAQGYPRTIKLHRFIMKVARKGQADILVDHKDRNPTNNTRDNLRLATIFGNNRNIHDSEGEGLWGATKSKSKTNPWVSYYRYRGQTVYNGLFKTEKEASDAAVVAFQKKTQRVPDLVKFIRGPFEVPV